MAVDDAELSARANARVGSVLRGKYTIDSVLGAGGMAVVYAVTHRNRKRFALKMLHPELSRQGNMRDRFLREGYVANTVGHSGAVAVLDDDVDDEGAAFLVMELLEGESVEQLWERLGRRLPPRAVVAIGHQLLEVLEAAHAKGVVHRDIKPGNVFITQDGTLKVLDFGIARLRESTDVGHTTNTGAIFGTPAFMSPEQAAGRFREVDEQTDVWAVGATMFALLTGRIVHDAENANALLLAAATLEAPALASVAPETPAALGAIVDRALARSKTERWPSAVVMREALVRASVELFGVEPARAWLVGLDRSSVVTTTRRSAGHTDPARLPSADARTQESPSSKPATPPQHVSPLAATLESGQPPYRVVVDEAASTPEGRSASGLARTAAALPGLSTSAPVSTAAASATPLTDTTALSRKRALLAIPVIAVVLLIGFGILRTRPSHSGVPSTGTSTASMVEVAPEPPPSAAPSATTVLAPSAASPLAVPSPSASTPPSAPTPRPAITPAPATTKPPASPNSCFYFDTQLKRLVARPGCH